MDISGKNILVFDIETVADSFDEMPEETQTYLTRYADTEDKKAEVVESLAFNSFTSKIAAIGMLDYHDNKGCIMMNTVPETQFVNTHPNFKYLAYSEQEMIQKFWSIIAGKGYNFFVTFNGRDFDCPFMMLRSIYYKIKPAYNLMKGSDYGFREYHIDLLREFTFYTHSGKGARRKFNLDFYCQKFGIRSPKIDGVCGEKVGLMFNEGKYQEIADYCISDVIAEGQLFGFWNEYFNI